MIYLVSSDGYMESIMGDRYAVDAEGVAIIIAAYRMEYFMEKIRNVQVDFETLKVTFETKADYDEDMEWEAQEYELIAYELVKQWG